MSRPHLPGGRSRARLAPWVIALLVMALLASLAMNLLLYPPASRHGRLVAVSWGDGPGVPALYGAYVWLDGEAPQLRAMLTIYIDRPGLWASYEHSPRVLGPVNSPEQAVQQWGVLRWEPDGLHVGSGPQAVLVPAAELQRHR